MCTFDQLKHASVCVRVTGESICTDECELLTVYAYVQIILTGVFVYMTVHVTLVIFWEFEYSCPPVYELILTRIFAKVWREVTCVL